MAATLSFSASLSPIWGVEGICSSSWVFADSLAKRADRDGRQAFTKVNDVEKALYIGLKGTEVNTRSDKVDVRDQCFDGDDEDDRENGAETSLIADASASWVCVLKEDVRRWRADATGAAAKRDSLSGPSFGGSTADGVVDVDIPEALGLRVPEVERNASLKAFQHATTVDDDSTAFLGVLHHKGTPSAAVPDSSWSSVEDSHIRTIPRGNIMSSTGNCSVSMKPAYNESSIRRRTGFLVQTNGADFRWRDDNIFYFPTVTRIAAPSLMEFTPPMPGELSPLSHVVGEIEVLGKSGAMDDILVVNASDMGLPAVTLTPKAVKNGLKIGEIRRTTSPVHERIELLTALSAAIALSLAVYIRRRSWCDCWWQREVGPPGIKVTIERDFDRPSATTAKAPEPAIAETPAAMAAAMAAAAETRATIVVRNAPAVFHAGAEPSPNLKSSEGSSSPPAERSVPVKEPTGTEPSSSLSPPVCASNVDAVDGQEEEGEEGPTATHEGACTTPPATGESAATVTPVTSMPCTSAPAPAQTSSFHRTAGHTSECPLAPSATGSQRPATTPAPKSVPPPITEGQVPEPAVTVPPPVTSPAEIELSNVSSASHVAPQPAASLDVSENGLPSFGLSGETCTPAAVDGAAKQEQGKDTATEDYQRTPPAGRCHEGEGLQPSLGGNDVSTARDACSEDNGELPPTSEESGGIDDSKARSSCTGGDDEESQLDRDKEKKRRRNKKKRLNKKKRVKPGKSEECLNEKATSNPPENKPSASPRGIVGGRNAVRLGSSTNPKDSAVLPVVQESTHPPGPTASAPPSSAGSKSSPLSPGPTGSSAAADSNGSSVPDPQGIGIAPGREGGASSPGLVDSASSPWLQAKPGRGKKHGSQEQSKDQGCRNDSLVSTTTTLLRGMNNSGNLCFFNSAIQFMRKMPALHAKLLAFPTRNKHPTRDQELTREIAKTMKAMEKNDRCQPLPRQGPLLFTFYMTFHAQFERGDQQDMGEVLLAIFDRMHDETVDEAGSSIVDSVRGILRETNQCQICHYESSTQHPCYVLHLLLPDGAQPEAGWSMRKLVQHSFGTRTDTDGPCNRCKTHILEKEVEATGLPRNEVYSRYQFEEGQKQTTTTTLVHVPDELCIYVQRFTAVQLYPPVFRKSDAPVRSSPSIDLARVFGCHVSGRSNIAAFSSHVGDSKGGGHWTTSQHCGGGIFAHCNDAIVTCDFINPKIQSHLTTLQLYVREH